MSNNLFTPIKLGPLRLPDRIVMAPMNRARCDAQRVHKAGGRLFQQIYHPGRKSDTSRMPGGAKGYMDYPALQSARQSAGAGA